MARIIRAQPTPTHSEASYEEGRAQGVLEGRAESAALLLAAHEERAHYQRQMAEGALSLAVELAAAIVGEVAREPKMTAKLAEKAWQAAGAKGATLKVPPGTHDAVKERLGEICEVLSDPSLSPGDCIVEAHWGRLDGRIQTQLVRLVEALRQSGVLAPE